MFSLLGYVNTADLCSIVGGGGPLTYLGSGNLSGVAKDKAILDSFPHTSHPPSTLSQGMARMCCDSRKSVRQTAITYLQRALLAHELQNLTSWEWEACFLEVSQAETTPPSALIHLYGYFLFPYSDVYRDVHSLKFAHTMYMYVATIYSIIIAA